VLTFASPGCPSHCVSGVSTFVIRDFHFNSNVLSCSSSLSFPDTWLLCTTQQPSQVVEKSAVSVSSNDVHLVQTKASTQQRLSEQVPKFLVAGRSTRYLDTGWYKLLNSQPRTLTPLMTTHPVCQQSVQRTAKDAILSWKGRVYRSNPAVFSSPTGSSEWRIIFDSDTPASVRSRLLEAYTRMLTTCVYSWDLRIAPSLTLRAHPVLRLWTSPLCKWSWYLGP
jgi:hypothetical protein